LQQNEKDAGWNLRLSCLEFFSICVLVSASAATTATAIAASSPTAATAAKTASATTAKSSATAAATKSPTTAAGFGACFIHVQRARPQLISIHCADGFFCFFVICHFHETEAAWLSGIAVFQNCNVFDLPVSCKSLPKLIFTDVKIQIAYINILHAILLYWSAGA
jgi:hypothetical protein